MATPSPPRFPFRRTRSAITPMPLTAPASTPRCGTTRCAFPASRGASRSASLVCCGRARGCAGWSGGHRGAGGRGWALVGDAYHQHDPLDGQGIFNALFTAKALALAIRDWRRGEKTWPQAADWYDETARIKTYGMYKTTLNSVRMNLYTNTQLPGWAMDGVRWVMEDPAMRDLVGQMLTRQMPPELMMVMAPPVVVGALVRGPLRDIRKRLADFGWPISR